MAKNSRDPAITKGKQEFVAKMVRANKNMSMYQVGEAVKTEFGSMIAFDKLRESFIAAGGKLGKRGRKPGSKNKPKAGKAASAPKSAASKPAKNTRDPKITVEKQAFVKKRVSQDSSLSMFQIGEEIKDEFGSMISFNKLREAFLAAGGKLGKRGRKPGSKNKPKADAGVRSAGRRKSDVAGYVARRALGRLSTHLVVVMGEDGTPIPYTFENKTEASNFVQKQLDGGTSFDRLGYYSKQEMGVRVSL